MGYPNFGKVKTIVLPIEDGDSGLTFDEYEKKYGLDIREIFRLYKNETTYSFELKENTLYLLSYGGVIKPLFIFNDTGIAVNYSFDGEGKFTVSSYIYLETDDDDPKGGVISIFEY